GGLNRTMPRGWPIVGWAAVVIGAMAAAILAVAGAGPDGIRVLIRATARTSVVLFSAAFVASSLARTAPGPATRWLLVNRRYVGVSFAVSHLAHFLAILALAGWSFSRMGRDAGPAARWRTPRMAEQKATNIVWHPGAVTRADREALNGHRGCIVWLTGLSGSGKSTIAVELEKRLWDRGVRAYVLDGDNVRHGLNK